MTTFWVYDDDGENGSPLSHSLPDALAEMNRLHPGWQSANSHWCMVEVNLEAKPNLQRFWYNDHTPTKWEAF